MVGEANAVQGQKFRSRIVHTIQFWIQVGLLVALQLRSCPGGELPGLRVSENHHFLVTETGQPFFWLGDTAWELLHRLNRADSERYLKKRADQGFTLIQTVVLAESNGLREPNAEGQLPLIDNDPLRPNEEYFKHVDWVVKRANDLGLYIGMLPTWGDKWNKRGGAGPEVFTAESAGAYGEWLGRRYQHAALVWILGGDRPVENDGQKEILRALATGLHKGDAGGHLITFHPTGGAGSAQSFHNEPWLDLNLRQNGHQAEFTGRYDQTRTDYERTPAKPVIDAEPLYEDHPIAFDAKKFGHSVAADVRRPLYWDLFSGACGHTYGHHSVWQMWTSNQTPINNPLMPWFEALDRPGAGQMQYAKKLLLSRPFFTRVPDDSVVVADRVPTSVPGAGRYRFVATRDSEGAFAMVYVPVSRPFKVRMDIIRGPKVKVWWFNPRNGTARGGGEFPNVGEHEFIPPDPEQGLDWVLVLDDANRHFHAPGQRIFENKARHEQDK
ncbi:MAG TPA: glycoside hydrolase family 140 protein [Candidatus Limnocylindrales bacterium]|nr:glycoside hydrolase family 140 protein [Candidatus Limnocylindrales bacterium]